MSSSVSDIPVVGGDDDSFSSGDLKVEHIIENIKHIVEKDGKVSRELNEYLDKVEEKIVTSSKKDLSSIDKENLRKLIEKHPYFKNPCSYHIRLITIMKYLKKKGVDVSMNDIDLLVDEIILSIDGVKKTGYGRYIRNK